jgi:site-specific recombinase XerD
VIISVARQIVFRYNGDASSDEELDDICGEEPIPAKNETYRRRNRTWKVVAVRTSAKALERMRSFFKFCLESDWIEKNPAKAIKAGKVEDADVLPFDESEVEEIVKACATFNGNGKRIRALTELMLASGLRIGDASTISRDRFVKDGKEWKVELRTARTGTKVYIPLQKEVVEGIQVLPGEFPFWSGDSTPENCSSVWQEAYRKLFKHAGVNGHPHRFRHTFAKNFLLSGVPLETVCLLLGHRKLAITESITLDSCRNAKS